MSLSKKYIYVHKCSTAQDTPDNFRKVLGRAWVPSSTAGLQYGYDVQPPVMDMTFGPYMEWAHDYFYSTEMPATTQIVSIKPNPYYFPPSESWTREIEIAEGGHGDIPTDGGTLLYDVPTSPCCGWYAYLGHFFKNHFSDGNPLQILRNVLLKRIKDHKLSLAFGNNDPLDKPHFPGDSCGSTTELGQEYIETVDPRGYEDDFIPGGIFVQRNVRLFKDLWFQIMTPFSQIEDTFLEGQEKAMPSDVKFNYNFYLDAYEQQLQGNTLSEIRIPNLYLTVGQDGSIPYVLYLQNNAKCRFKDFEKLVLQNGYREYLIPSKQQPWLQDKNIYSTSFPMDATVSFGTDRSTFVADALEDSKMECAMLRRASEGTIIVEATEPYTESTVNQTTPPEEDPLTFTYAKRYYETASPNQPNIPPYLAARPLRTFDFYQWLLDLPDLPPSAVPLPSDHVFLGNENDSTDMALRVGLYQQNLSFLANYFILSGKINEIARTHLRNYQQMMRGDTPHSETILYRISKYSTSALNQEFGQRPEFIEAQRSADFESLEAMFDLIYINKIEPIQNIWIPNTNSIDIIEYVDTQVKYNKGYTYTVTAYELSVGTEYFYSQYVSDPQRPQPNLQTCDKVGVLAAAGLYGGNDGIRDAVWLTDILESTWTDHEKYLAITSIVTTYNEWVSSSSNPVDACEGTGIAILAKEEYMGPQYDGPPRFQYGILCYCLNYSYDLEQWTLVADLQNTAASDYSASDSNPTETVSTAGTEACIVYAQLEVYLKAQIEVSNPGSAEAANLIELLQQWGITSPPTAEASAANRARFYTSSCPEGWIEGEKQSFTKEVSEKIPIGERLEAVFLGQANLDVTCECPPPEPCRETFLVTTFPSLKIHEVPYMLWSGRVVDSYPVGPDVEINPYRTVNNEMLFKIGAGLGDYYGVPIPIFNQDAKEFAELQRSQGSKDGTVLFRSDDPVQTFEMFTLTEKPKRYTDFALASRKVLSVKISDKPEQMADAVSTIENLTPNKKYYYIFRSVDIHGHISNPTPIYEVELVDTDGAIYPLINVYEPEVTLPIELSRTAQRLVQIRPEYLQSVLDEKASGIDGKSAGTPGGSAIGDIKLGKRDKKLWNKEFKLRLTSCESRRMLDINLKFETDHLTLDDCQPAETIKNFGVNENLDIPSDVPVPGKKSPIKEDLTKFGGRPERPVKVSGVTATSAAGKGKGGDKGRGY